MAFNKIVVLFICIMLWTHSTSSAQNPTTEEELRALKVDVKLMRDCLLNRIHELEVKLDAKEDIIHELEVNVRQQHHNIHELEVKVRHQDDRIHELQVKVGQLDAKEDKSGEIAQVISEMNILAREKQTRQSAAFSTYGISPGEGPVNVDDGDQVTYYRTHMNPGGHYSTVTGRYTCPVTGVYFFQFSVYAYNVSNYLTRRGNACLLKNGMCLMEVAVINYDSAAIRTTLANGMVLRCIAGEQVWLESIHDNVYLYNWNNVNLFSGFLIFEN